MSRYLLFVTLFFLVISCSPKEKISINVAGQVFLVEVADDPQERQKGLMNRETLNRGEGMLFVFPESKPQNFWMKNTLIPLSIAYIDDEGIIIDILPMEPLDLSPVSSSGPARYALEVNQGEFAYHRIKVGDKVDIPSKYR